VLAEHGLHPEPVQMLDEEHGVSLVSWQR
jgi:hypothetical protein